MDELSEHDTVVTRLKHWSMANPDKPAFIYSAPGGQRHVFTREQLYSLSRRAATWLRKKGITERDRILVLPTQSPEQLFMVMGATVLGVVTLTSQIILSDGRDIISAAQCGDLTTIVVDRSDEMSVSILKKFIPDFKEGTVKCSVVPTLKRVTFCNNAAWGSQPSFIDAISCEDEVEPVDCDPDDVAVLMATSGSTGLQKLVPRTHRQVLKIGQLSVTAFGVRKDDTVFNAGGFGWISGFPTQYLATGITRVLPLTTGAPPADPTKHLWDLLCQEKPTAGYFHPTVIEHLLGRPDLVYQKGAWRLRVMSTGSRPVNKNVLCVLGVLASEIRVVYGSTEAGFNLCKSYTEETQPFQAENFNCGKPFMDQKVRVVNDELQDVPANTKGQLLIKNEVIFSGYLKQPGETQEMMAEGGWFKPGDVASVDDSGDVFVYGRGSDVIVISSLSLYPEPMEVQLLDLPGVAEVALLSVPDEEFMNRPCLCVVPDTTLTGNSPTSDDILEASAAIFNKDLVESFAYWKAAIPKFCLFFQQFPKSLNGKLQRKLLRQQVLERLGIQE